MSKTLIALAAALSMGPFSARSVDTAPCCSMSQGSTIPKKLRKQRTAAKKRAKRAKQSNS